MKIAIACDHGGYLLKQDILIWLEEHDIDYEDFGCYSTESVDYPVFAEKAARAVADGVGTCTAESLLQVRYLQDAARKAAKRLPVVLRLNAGAADFALPALSDGWEILLIDNFQMIPAEDGGQALCELIRSDPGKRFLLL